MEHKRGPFTTCQISVLVHLGSIDASTSIYGGDEVSWQRFDMCDTLRLELAKLLAAEPSGALNPRLPMSQVPIIESFACQDQTCSKWPSCDIVFVWDRKERMWLTYEEYAKACADDGLVEGLPERALADAEQIADLFKENHQKAVSAGTSAGDKVDEDEPLSDPEKEAKRQKRRAYRERKKLKREAGVWTKSKENPNIYVSCLPKEVSEEELVDLFKRTGQIKLDLETSRPRVRLYGHGDALVTFVHNESVELAIDRFNGWEIRPGASISVQRASFEERMERLSRQELEAVAQVNRDKRRKLLEFNRKEKLLRSTWDVADYQVYAVSKNPVVVFTKCFDPREGNTIDYAFIESELMKYAGKFGSVKKVKAIEDSLDGYVCVKFASAEAAKLCVAATADGDCFTAFLHDGRDLSSRQLHHDSLERELQMDKDIAWDDFLYDDSSDDSDLVIRTE